MDEKNWLLIPKAGGDSSDFTGGWFINFNMVRKIEVISMEEVKLWLDENDFTALSGKDATEFLEFVQRRARTADGRPVPL